MAYITHTFNYAKPDEYLGQFDNEQLVGTHTYEGPDTMWVFIDKATNKIAPAGYMNEEEGMDFNPPINLKKVFVDCREFPIICSLMEADQDDEAHATVVETLPNGVEYTTYVDPDPHHTYEKFDIECNSNDEFIKVSSSIKGGTPHYPWKKPHISWAHLRRHRTSLLTWSDDKTSDDMPSSLIALWATYRQDLRDIPVSFGDSFKVDITAGGSNYEVGDKIKFAKADLDNFIIADHLIATVKTVNSGAITALTLSGNQAINDGNDIVEGRAAKEFVDATFTYEAVADGADAGTSATFKVHKCQRYAAWKVDVPRSPCGTA
tara:strand:+ start:705 stop:1664 length:960 start_codon:yes stop_codon:yes gene_type:complete